METPMKWKAAPHVLVLVIALALSLGTLVGQAQPGNLLSNPGFEGQFANQGGSPARLVAQGWTPWNLPAEEGMSYSEMLQPEYYPAANTSAGLGPARVRTGSDAQRMQVFFGTFTAGVFQQVANLAAGQQYTFGAQIYVWSTGFDDPNASQQDGGVTVQVGFDPAGGTDPESSTIVWSDFVAPKYDAWTYYSVVASAQGNNGSVWVRATVTTPVKHNVVFIDDAVLVTGAATVAPATTAPATLVPPTSVPPSATPVPPTATPVPPTVPPTATFTPTITLTPSPMPTVDNTQFPGRMFYTVQQFDTVALIAQQFGSSVQAIISANNLSPQGLIFVGQVLVIPVTLNVPTAAPPTAVPPTVAPPTTAPPTSGPTVPPTPAPSTIYIVRPGDTLFGIALRFSTTVSALQRANSIPNVNLIYVGQRLIIPAPGPVGPVPTAITIPSNNVPGSVITPTSVMRVYTVRPGDNLYTLAIRYNTTVWDIARVNGLNDPNLIFVGQVLTIP